MPTEPQASMKAAASGSIGCRLLGSMRPSVPRWPAASLATLSRVSFSSRAKWGATRS